MVSSYLQVHNDIRENRVRIEKLKIENDAVFVVIHSFYNDFVKKD